MNRIYTGDRLSRPELRGRRCRVLTTWRGRHSIRNVRLVFVDGATTTCPVRCIRKTPEAKKQQCRKPKAKHRAPATAGGR